MTISGEQQPSPQEKYSFSYYEGNLYGVPDRWGYGGSGNYLDNYFRSYQLLWGKSLTSAMDHYVPLYLNLNQNISFGDRSLKDAPATDYSLKRITFPAGGFTEYEYETHSDDYGPRVGGLRIKKIISKPSETASPVITEFRYADTHFDAGIGDMDFLGTSYLMSIWAHVARPGQIFPSKKYTCARTLSFSATPVQSSLLNYNPIYGKVTTLQYDQNMEKYSGKTVSVYNNKRSYSREIPQRAKITPFGGDESGGKEISTFDPWGRNFWIDTYFGYSPVLVSRTWYDNDERIKRKEEYTYTEIPKGTFRELRTNEKIVYRWKNIAQNGTQELSINEYTAYDYISSRYDYIDYELKLGFHRLDGKHTTEYTDNGEITFDELYFYNQDHRLIRKTTDKLSESYRYPGDFTDQVYTNMVAANILSPVIEKTRYIGSGHYQTETARVKTNYVYRNEMYLPVAIQSKTPSVDYRTEISFDEYDAKGNILQYTTLDGVSVVYVWAYGGQYPIAEIRNATYSQLTEVIGQSTLNAISNRAQPTASDLTLINNLRTNPALPDAAITTYTYKPLVGILTATEPSGRKTTYEYDPLGRLIRVKDHNGKTLEEYEYSLRNALIQ